MRNIKVRAIILTVIVCTPYLFIERHPTNAVAAVPAPTSTTSTTFTTTTTLVSSTDMQKWTKVSICEQGGRWHIQGPRFSGGLGISNHNWDFFGGREFAPNAGLATPEQQVVIAKRIQAYGGVPNYVPDQYECDGSW